jgi:dTDP-3-amino-2,3,6-trideoxy-4-keto-D-glucose/dTDP-3-amino-3,4,6-trideoxy-alpha-D-glucose/dTDP-2,6-dideoxy-D-kanosamine transaminase
LSTRSLIPLNDLRRGIAADDEVAETVERVVRGGRYLLGEETAGFEAELADYLGVRYVVGVASGTDALQLALMAMGGGRGGEIVTAANAGGYGTIAARCCGMDVRYADVDDGDLLMTAGSVEAALTPRTTIIVVTHLYGKMAPTAAICDLCHAKGILVLEDCAQAAGARATGRYAGSMGDAAAFSFYPTKNLAAIGDGGAVVTSDAGIAARARRLAQYGWGRKYLVEEGGGKNSRLDEIQAAVLRVRLPRLDEFNQRRREVVQRYVDALLPHVGAMAQDGEDDYVAHLAVIRTPCRPALADELSARSIRTDVHYPVPDHRQKIIGAPDVELPVVDGASREVLSLPCFPELTDEELEIICAALSELAEFL